MEYLWIMMLMAVAITSATTIVLFRLIENVRRRKAVVSALMYVTFVAVFFYVDVVTFDQSWAVPIYITCFIVVPVAVYYVAYNLQRVPKTTVDIMRPTDFPGGERNHSAEKAIQQVKESMWLSDEKKMESRWEAAGHEWESSVAIIYESVEESAPPEITTREFDELQKESLHDELCIILGSRVTSFIDKSNSEQSERAVPIVFLKDKVDSEQNHHSKKPTFEEYYRQATVLKTEGAFAAAAAYFAESAKVSDDDSHSKGALFEEISCYVKAENNDKALMVSALLKSKDLTPAETTKLDVMCIMLKCKVSTA